MTDTRSQPSIVERLSHPDFFVRTGTRYDLNEAIARIQELESVVGLLESNARVQAKLLADTGRRVEEMEDLGRFLVARLQEFDPGDFEAEREFHGHVAPALARFSAALSSGDAKP